MKRWLLAFVLICSLLPITACWDQVEINKRVYIMAVGVDEYDEKKADILSIIQPEAPKYNFLFEIASWGDVRENGGGGHGSFQITVGTHSLPQALDILETTVENPAILTHILAIVITEPVAREGIVEITDYMVRSLEVRRNTHVFITPGRASDIFAFKPEISGTVGEFLGELTLNAESTSLVLVEGDLGVVTYSLANHMDYLLPILTVNQDRVVSSGGAVFSKEGKLLGWLRDEETIDGTRLLRGLYRRGNVSVVCPATNSMVIVRIKTVKTKIKTSQAMSASIDITVAGNIATNLGGHVQLNEDYLSKINRGVEAAIKARVEKSLRYFQQDLEADVFFFSMLFKQYQYKAWKEHRDNWPNVFADMEVEINVSSRIENIGSIENIR